MPWAVDLSAIILRLYNPTMPDFIIRPVEEQDKDWILQLTREEWAADFIVVHGETFYPAELAGFVAESGGSQTGLVTYRVTGESCEILTLNSRESGRGLGGALIGAVKAAALRAGCRRLWLVTTNANLNALGFYQRKGFTLCALRPNALEETRRRKPVPLFSEDGIPIRDEIDLEMKLKQD